jgi:hypothetical protein
MRFGASSPERAREMDDAAWPRRGGKVRLGRSPAIDAMFTIDQRCALRGAESRP